MQHLCCTIAFCSSAWCCEPIFLEFLCALVEVGLARPRGDIEVALERATSAHCNRNRTAANGESSTGPVSVGGKADDLLHVDTQCFGLTWFGDVAKVLLDDVNEAIVHEFLLRTAVGGVK